MKVIRVGNKKYVNEINKDADIIIMDDDYYIDTVISKGNTIVKIKS